MKQDNYPIYVKEAKSGGCKMYFELDQFSHVKLCILLLAATPTCN